MKTSYLLGAPLLAIALMGLGCNPFASMEKKIGEKVVEGMIERGSGGKVDVDVTGEGGLSVTGKDGEKATFGTDQLPSGFPSDLPRYPGGKIVLASVTEAGKRATLSQTVEADAETVLAWYDSTLKANGFAVEGSGSSGFNFHKYVKGDAHIVITVYSQPADDGKTYSSITAGYEMK